MSKLLRILLADDHATIREGLKLLVDSQPDMETIGEACDGREAVRLAQELLPDVVVMDVSMPELNGLQATKKIAQKCEQVRILTLTRHTDDGYLQQLLRAGANGYVLKQSKSEELLRAIRQVAAGNTYLDPAVTETVVAKIRANKQSLRGEIANQALSERETEVLRLIAWGYINKEIAARLNLSVKTVEAHKSSAVRKMGMKSRVDIVRYALLQGWLQDS